MLWLEQDVSIHDDFFDLGGHSLLASVLVSEIESAFDTKIPVAALFRLSTVSELAGHLEATLGALTDSLARNLTESDPEATIETHRLPDDIFRRILAFTSGWRGERASPHGGLIVGLNLGGYKAPLFWCLQGFEELQQLAKYLGETQPTYGMRSGHLAMQHSAQNIRALAAQYVSEIVSVEPVGPYLVGGNCQGSYIAWAVAEELRRQGRAVPLLSLLLLDYRQALPYQGRTALFFGSEISDPCGMQDVREPDWQELFPGGVSIDPISGGHIWHFVEPHIQDFAEKLSRRIEQAVADHKEGPEASRECKEASDDAPRGVVVLGMHGAGSSVISDILLQLWQRIPGVEVAGPSHRIVEIHEGFFESINRSWDDTSPLEGAVFHGQAAIEARTRIREVIGELDACTRWVVDDPRMCRVLPLWDGLFPIDHEVHFLHVLRSPQVVADFLEKRDGFSREKSLLLWMKHNLEAEAATRDRKRSWLKFEALGAAQSRMSGGEAVRAAAGPLEEFEKRFGEALEEMVGIGLLDAEIPSCSARDVLRFHPWVGGSYRALVDLAEGREITSRVKLDALRFGLDDEKRSRELDRLQEENDRLREKNHHVWQESVRVRQENDCGQTEIEHLREKNRRARQESQRVQEEIDRAQADNERLRAELDKIQQALVETEVAFRHAQSEHGVIRQKLERELHDFQQRRSWKLTAPLRWLYALIHRTGQNS